MSSVCVRDVSFFHQSRSPMAIPGLLYAIPVDIEIDCGTITIPALAGEPKRAASRDHRSRDYPRARGGTNLSGLPFSFGPGLSPRSRGNHLCDPEPGSSPGTIPALAGEPGCRIGRRVDRGYYPRARGGTRHQASDEMVKAGLSPRSRGNRSIRLILRSYSGTIPALAGEPCVSRGLSGNLRDYPRARGGTSAICTRHRLIEGLSPRSRGNRIDALRDGKRSGTIPALAGEP